MPARANAPVLVARRLLELVPDEERARRGTLPAPSLDFAPLLARRSLDVAPEAQSARRGSFVQQRVDASPRQGRRWYSDDSFPDERTNRPRYLVAISIPPFAGGCAHVDYLEQSAHAGFALQRAFACSSEQSAHATSYLC